MGRRSGYDRSGLPQGAPGARRDGQPPGAHDHNRAAPASQGGPPSTLTGSSNQGSRQGGSQGLRASGTNQQVPPGSSRGNATLPAGFVPAHHPGERRASHEYDSAREYAAVETGRLERQRPVPEGSSGLQREVLNLEGPAEMPPVRAVPRVGGRGSGSVPGPQPLSHMQPTLKAAPSSSLPPPGRASGVASQGSERARVWAASEYARRHPFAQHPVPSAHELASLVREYQVLTAAGHAGVSSAHGTGMFCFPSFHISLYWVSA